jgi:nucleoside-diphosphate-sugar epimerase
VLSNKRRRSLEKSNGIFITGASGFIGGHLAKRLLTHREDDQYERIFVRALVRNPDKASWLRSLGAEIVPGDILDPALLTQAMQGCQVVYHAAAWVSEGGSKPEVWEVNVEGTRNVVNAAISGQTSGEVKRFIHLSSCAVYGSLQAFDIDETTPTRMTGKLYADSKVAAEEVVFQAYREQHLPVVVARVSQVYGPGSQQFTIRPVEVIKSGKMVLIDGGQYLCKPIYIDNLIDALILCAKEDAAIGEAINLTDGISVSWREFFGAYGKMLGINYFPSLPYPAAWLAALAFETQAKLKGKKAGLTRRAVQSLRSSNSFSNQKARHLLGWEPRVDLVEGMHRCQIWLREEGYL